MGAINNILNIGDVVCRYAPEIIKGIFLVCQTIRNKAKALIFINYFIKNKRTDKIKLRPPYCGGFLYKLGGCITKKTYFYYLLLLLFYASPQTNLLLPGCAMRLFVVFLTALCLRLGWLFFWQCRLP